MSLLNSQNAAIIQALPDTILVFDQDNCLIDFRPGEGVALFRKVPERARLEQLWPPELAEQYDYFLNQARKSGVLQICEHSIQLEKEEVFEARFVPNHNSTMVILRNITLRKNTEDRLVQMMLKLQESHEHLDRLKKQLGQTKEFHGMIGSSKLMQQVYQQIKELAPLPVTVLVQGETGTGKELVARALHQESSRQHKPFIAVNCAGLTEGSLLMSQLFGHKKGAFTGALQEQIGFIEAADGGTLFLDELGDIPLDVQTNLLRFLQEKEITRLGESQPRKMDVRIIAATQYDLLKRVQEGLFRKDLYYRIHVASILLPPLRERRDDIPLLSQFFLKQSQKLTGKPISQIHPYAMELLIQKEWPGNIRELQGLIEASVIRCQDFLLMPKDLKLEKAMNSNHSAHLSESERIESALKTTGGNRVKAAQVLGISRATLYRKLKLHQVILPRKNRVSRSHTRSL